MILVNPHTEVHMRVRHPIRTGAFISGAKADLRFAMGGGNVFSSPP